MGSVDVWAQILTERMAAAPWLEPLLRWTGRPGELLLSTVETTLQAMDEADIDISLLSAWHGPGQSLISNAEVAAQVEQAPERFRGIATVDLHRPVDAVATIREWVDGERFVGVRVLPWLWDLPPNDRRYYPVYVACVEAGVPFCTQIGHTGPRSSAAPHGASSGCRCPFERHGACLGRSTGPTSDRAARRRGGL